MSSPSYIIVVLSISLVLVPISTEDLLGSVADIFKEPICSNMQCGRGTCITDRDQVFGFKCDCHSGWKRWFSEDPNYHGFFPCLIPNCTILDSTCSKDEMPKPEDKGPISRDPSVFNPCDWAFCGEGICVRHEIIGNAMQSLFRYSCKCKPGAANLYDDPDYPCFNECSLGADCRSKITNKETIVEGASGNVIKEINGSSVLREKLLWKVILTVIMAIKLFS